MNHLKHFYALNLKSYYFQDLLRAACHYCDHFPCKKLTEIDAIFTFNADGYITFDQNKWDTYMVAMCGFLRLQ